MTGTAGNMAEHLLPIMGGGTLELLYAMAALHQQQQLKQNFRTEQASGSAVRDAQHVTFVQYTPGVRPKRGKPIPIHKLTLIQTRLILVYSWCTARINFSFVFGCPAILGLTLD